MGYATLVALAIGENTSAAYVGQNMAASTVGKVVSGKRAVHPSKRAELYRYTLT